MKKFIIGAAVFLMIASAAATAAAYGEATFDNPMYATSAEAGWFYVVDQNGVQNTWMVQGPDQNWAGAAVIQPGVLNYANFLGTPNQESAGWGGQASGGSLVVGFDEAFTDGDGDDFIVHGFGLGFNSPFSDETGTVRVYVSATFDNTSHTTTNWTLLSEWQGRVNGEWIGNPDFNYDSGVGEYGWILKGDLADAGLASARYIKIEIGDGNHHVKTNGTVVTHGRALFIDSVEARGETAAENHAPVFGAIENQTTVEGEELAFTISATDPDGDGIAYTFDSDPAMNGATLDPATGAFSWTPPDGSTGIHSVTFTATDDGTPPQHAEKTITVSVGDVNHPPEFSDCGSKPILEGMLLQFSVSATDPDGDALTYSASGVPSGASFSGTSFSWTPGYDQAGEYTVTFTVTDNGTPPESDSLTVTITVGNADPPTPDENNPPVFSPVNDRTVKAGETLEFTVSATDPDGDALTYGASGLPSGASFTGTGFSWTPEESQAGVYTVVFTVTDDGTPAESASAEVKITVTDAQPPDENNPPAFSPIDDRTVKAGETLEFTVSATDPDGDVLTYDASGLPSGASFTGTGFSWTPEESQTGVYTVVFTVTDDGTPAESASAEVKITVTDAQPPDENNPPAFSPVDDRTVTEGEVLEFTVSATDPDGDSIAYSVKNAPEGAEFNGTTGLFSWTPPEGSSGDYIITFTATEVETADKLTASTTAVVHVKTAGPPAGENSPPDAPEITEFTGSVSTTPELSAGGFNDPDEGDIHYKTRWQISNASDFADGTIIFESEGTGNLTRINVPDFILETDSTYYMRVRFYDNKSDFSPWASSAFTTASESDDGPTENGVPVASLIPTGTVALDDTFTDGEGNPINDDHAKSLVSAAPAGSEYEGLQIGLKSDNASGVRITDIRPVEYSPEAYADSPVKPENMPFGTVSFKLDVTGAAGEYAEITIHFSEPVPSGYSWWKYSVENGWYEMDAEYAVISADRKAITLKIMDNGQGDDSPLEGVIVDPGGIAESGGSQDGTGDGTTDPGNNGEESDGGSSSTCFISTCMGSLF